MHGSRTTNLPSPLIISPLREVSGIWLHNSMATSQLMLSAVAIIIILAWLFMWLLHFIALINGKWRLHRKRVLTSQVEKSLPGVSILKPLCSAGDPNLYANLETFFKQDYPKYEILICLQDDCGQLMMYSESLRKKYPDVDCQVFLHTEMVGVNPKINNMHPGYQAAKYELILISDSGIRMKEDTLKDMVASMTEEVGLVHQMPFACDRKGIPATLEKVFFGTNHARIYLSANFLGINCATGMSCLMRKDVLDEAGGIKAFGCYLAEDFFFAKTFLKKGLRIDISSQPAQQSPGDTSISGFLSRITRWAKLRGAMCPHLLILEPLSECVSLGLLSSWAFAFLVHCDPLSFFIVHVLCWFILDWLLLCIVQNGSLPFNKFEFLVIWLFRESSAPFLFMSALWNPTIKWRSKLFRLRWGGIAEAVAE